VINFVCFKIGVYDVEQIIIVIMFSMIRKWLEYVAVLTHLSLLTSLPFATIIILYILLYRIGSIWAIIATICYLLFLYFDISRSEGIGIASKYLRKSRYMKLLISYFSVKMKSVVDIPKNKNYIIGVHPHGVIANGLLGYSKMDDFEKIFGDSVFKFATSSYNVRVPLQREYFFSLGAINASEESFKRYLRPSKNGRILIVVVGGAAEVLKCTPNEHRIILKRRKGFCRMALVTGTSLIPAYVFGENELWDTVQPKEGTFLRTVQELILKYVGVGVPILKGSSWWHYLLVMPKRRPLTVVHGEPIVVNKNTNPNKIDVDELHKKYIDGLKTLFNSEKHKYLSNPDVELIVE